MLNYGSASILTPWICPRFNVVKCFKHIANWNIAWSSMPSYQLLFFKFQKVVSLYTKCYCFHILESHKCTIIREKFSLLFVTTHTILTYQWHFSIKYFICIKKKCLAEIFLYYNKLQFKCYCKFQLFISQIIVIVWREKF